MVQARSTAAPQPDPDGPAARRPVTGGFQPPARRGPGSYDRRQSAEVRRAEQRALLVDAASHVFARDGFASSSVASILAASGLSRGTFYRHFDDLRAVFAAAQDVAAKTLLDRIEEAHRSAEGPVERLRAVVAAYLELCAAHGDITRMFHREALVSGQHYAELRARNLGRIAALFRSDLRSAAEQGLVRRVPDELTLHAVIVGIEGAAMYLLEQHREQELPAAAEPLTRLALRAFS